MTRFLTGRRTKYAVLALWLVLTAALAPLALKLTGAQDRESLGALPSSAEAERAADRAAAAFPEREALTAVAVYARDGGLTAADRAKVTADRTAFQRYAEGGRVPPEEPSADGQALLVAFPLAGDADEQAAAATAVRERVLADVPAGLRAALTGSAGAEHDIFDAFEGMDLTLLAVTGAAVALILLITYRSPVLWLIPLLVVGVANQVAGAWVYLLSAHAGLTVDFQSQSILTILVFGVGVDYALLLIARYREELRRHADRHRAMAEALRRSYPALLASAATVAIALLCLLAADLPATRGLGPVGAVGIVAAFLAMTTLLPAVLVLFGRWLFWPFVPRHDPRASDPRAVDRAGRREAGPPHRVWRRLATGVGRRPRVAWVVTLVALAALTPGIGNLDVGIPADEMFRQEVGSVTGQRLIEAHYPGGTAEPADVLAAAGTADRVAVVARAVDGVATVEVPVISADGRWARIRVLLADAPESRAALAAVERLRTAVRDVPDARALVGGQTAYALDTERTNARDMRVVAPMILLVVFVILVLLLRSLVAPALLVASVVASYAAARGAAGFILDAMGYPRLWDAIPLQAFLFLVALGVDYTIFLMTRAREEVGRLGHRPGVLHALTVTGGVVTSAGVVLAATFAALSVLPLTPSVQTGVIIAVGILLDTLLVRTVLVPALALDLGPRTWWPSRPAAPTEAPAVTGGPVPAAVGP
jgi:RND superfamily putative drug exporter